MMEAGKLKVGEYAMINDRPCKIRTIKKSKPGKHGHAKCHITASDLFSTDLHSFVRPTNTLVYKFTPTIDELELVYVNRETDEFELMAEDGKLQKMPIEDENLAVSWNAGSQFKVTVITAPEMVKEKMVKLATHFEP
jgi:translation initiation factor 5A